MLDHHDLHPRDRRRVGAPPPPPAPLSHIPPVDWNNTFIYCGADDWRATAREVVIDGVQTSIGIGMPEALLTSGAGKKGVALTDPQIAILRSKNIAIEPVGDGTKFDIADADVQLGRYYRPRLYNERKN